jgi:hypothetical protein
MFSAEIVWRVGSEVISIGEFPMHTRTCKRVFISAILASTVELSVSIAQAADTIKAGVLLSLWGTMAISETTVTDTGLIMIEDQNKNGAGYW